MSATASVVQAFQPRRKRSEQWDTPPERNAHLVRYCVHAQDPLKRKPLVRLLYDLLHAKARRLDKERKIIEVSLNELRFWTGDEIRTKYNPGESDSAAEPVPRSTLTYWLELLLALHLVERFDRDAEMACGPRTRGDGRHKSWYVVNSFDRALDLLVVDPNVAIPKNRCFWTLDSWPVSDAIAIERKLDIALAERYPEAWANNARAHNPRAPMKPLRPTVTVYASEAEAATVQRVLVDEPWKIATTPEQARERLLWAREVEGAARVPADWIAGHLNRTLEGMRQRYRAQNRYAPEQVHSIGLFTRDYMRGAAGVWLAEQRRRAAEASAVSGPRETFPQDGTGPDPPPPIPIPRKSFPN